MPKHPKTVALDSFSGINNVLSPERTDPKYLKELENLDVDKGGGLHLRNGFTQLDSTAKHSLWSNDKVCYAVEGTDLVQILEDYTTSSITTLNGPDNTVYFTEINGDIYYVSKTDTGFIRNNVRRNLGVHTYPGQPLLSAGTGGLSAGTYQVAVIYVADDGRMSATNLASTITVSDNASIVLSGLLPALDPTVSYIRIYCTTANGSTLFYIDDVADTAGTYTISSLRGAVVPISTFNKTVPPTGTKIAYYNARLYIASGSLLMYSDPLHYEIFDLANNVIQFPDDIKAVCPVDDGIWVGAGDRIYYLSGGDATSFKLTEKEIASVVEDTAERIPGAYIFIENTPLGDKWLITTDRGIFAAMNSGVILNLTEKNVSFPKASIGTGKFIQVDGINKYVSLLKEPDSSNQNVAVGDLITAQVIRNGVVID